MDAQNRTAAEHLKALIACPSVTPHEGGALAYLEDVLSAAGFRVWRETFSESGTADVENLFAVIGDQGPHLMFAGHTDVVPPGDEASWTHPPFSGTVHGGEMYGRGAVDMKGGIACFLTAVLAQIRNGHLPQGRISLLITGDEEGPAINGTVKLLDWAVAQGHRFDACIVGEPTSQETIGDAVKIGRRGSISAVMRVTGQQGHAAYPHLADNPVPDMIKALAVLDGLHFDDGTEAFQPTNLEITSVDAGNEATNVIPGAITARFNVRFNDRWTPETVQEHIANALAEADIRPVEIDWILPAWGAFLTRDQALIDTISGAIRDETGHTPSLSTGGGTSDARFIKDVCPVVECGLIGKTMHAVDERVPVDDLTALTGIYSRFLDAYLAGDPR